jgi:outer membrane lipoprotein-sorting protein
MLKKQSIVVMLFLFVFVLSSCSGFVIQGDFNKGLEKLKSLESYKVTIKNEIISSSGVSKGESIISNTSFYKGIIEYIDAAEEENALVALTKENLSAESTHLEVDPIDLTRLGLAG